MPFALFLHLGPYIAMAVMGLGLFGLWEMHKVDAAQHKDDTAIIQQNLKDHAESEKQIGILQTKLENVDAKVQPIIQRIVEAPKTTGCGPSVGYSADGVRDLFGASQVNAGPKPAIKAGMPTPLSPPTPTK